MAIVERGNVVLEIADDDITRYLNKGYSVTDGKGNIVKQAIPKDIGELQRLVIKYEQEVKELRAELEALKSKTAESESNTVEEKPKRKTRKAE